MSGKVIDELMHRIESMEKENNKMKELAKEARLMEDNLIKFKKEKLIEKENAINQKNNISKLLNHKSELKGKEIIRKKELQKQKLIIQQKLQDLRNKRLSITKERKLLEEKNGKITEEISTETEEVKIK
jgi:hypothetical protein